MRELAAAVGKGYECYIAFAIGLPGVAEVRPNTEIMPEFGLAMEEAKAAGVQTLFLPCKITDKSMEIDADYLSKNLFDL